LPESHFPRFRWLVVHPAHWPNDYHGTGFLTRRITGPPSPSHPSTGVAGSGI